MSEIFDIVSAINRLKDRVDNLSSRIDSLCKHPSTIESEKYVDQKTACKILRIKPVLIWQMRKRGEIDFIRHHRKILYPIESVQKYLASQTQKTQPSG